MQIASESFEGPKGEDFKRLVAFMSKIQFCGLLEKENTKGLIMVADDQYVNTQSMLFALTDLGLADRTRFF